MKILKSLGVFFIYVLFLIAYGVSTLYSNYTETLILSIIIIIVLIIITGKYIIDIVRKEDKDKYKIFEGILNILFISVIIASMFVLKECYKYQDKKIPFGVAWFKYSAEPLDYNENFKTTIYKNNKIRHTKEQEIAIDLIKSYIDETIMFSKGIFGDFDISDITIKLDYDKNVFDKRAGNENLAGYYMIEEKAMYMAIEEIYDDFIAGSKFILDDETGANIILNYKKTFLHEYTHHILYEFLRTNKINSTDIPTWFNEGVSDYVSSKGSFNIFTPTIKEIKKFNEIDTAEKWENESSKTGNTVYIQSHIAVDMIVKEKGKKAIRDIIMKSKEFGFSNAFEKVMGKSLESFENEMKLDLENDFKKYLSYQNIRDINNNSEVEAQVLERYIASNEKNIDAYIDLYIIYINDFDDVNKGIKLLEYGAEKNPSNKEILKQLKTAYEYSNNEEKAKEVEKVINSI